MSDNLKVESKDKTYSTIEFVKDYMCANDDEELENWVLNIYNNGQIVVRLFCWNENIESIYILEELTIEEVLGMLLLAKENFGLDDVSYASVCQLQVKREKLTTYNILRLAWKMSELPKIYHGFKFYFTAGEKYALKILIQKIQNKFSTYTVNRLKWEKCFDYITDWYIHAEDSTDGYFPHGQDYKYYIAEVYAKDFNS